MENYLDGHLLQQNKHYHIFVFECNEKSSGKVYFELAKIQGYGDEEVIDERNYKIMQMSGIPKIAEINRKIKGE